MQQTRATTHTQRPRAAGASPRPEREPDERQRNDVEDVALVEVLDTVDVERGADERDATSIARNVGSATAANSRTGSDARLDSPRDHDGRRGKRGDGDVEHEVAGQVREPFRDLARRGTRRTSPTATRASRTGRRRSRSRRRRARATRARRARPSGEPAQIRPPRRTRHRSAAYSASRADVRADQRDALDPCERDDPETDQRERLVRRSRPRTARAISSTDSRKTG